VLHGVFVDLHVTERRRLVPFTLVAGALRPIWETLTDKSKTYFLYHR